MVKSYSNDTISGTLTVLGLVTAPSFTGTARVRSVAAAPKTTAAVNLPEPSTGTEIATVTLDKPSYWLRPPGAPGYMSNIAAGSRRRYTAASITGDLDVRVKLAPTSWASGTSQNLVGKYGEADGRRGWLFTLAAAGGLTFSWSTGFASSTFLQDSSSAAVGFAAGQPGWVRAVMDVDNGASGNTVTFYTSTDGVTWTTLGVAQTKAGVTNIYDNITAQPDYTLGNSDGGSLAMLGDLYQVEIRNGIGGTTVTPTDPSLWTSSTGSLTVYPVVPPVAGSTLSVVLTQDATGSRTVTWPSNVKWPGGTAPTLSTAANALDYLQLDCVDGTNWLGRSLGLAYA